MSTQTNTFNSNPTSEGANTMTNSNENAPKVKAAHPELYAEHTFHMKRAKNFTYNYCVIDEVLLEFWDEMSAREIAEVMNEYPHRIIYRVQVLKTLGLIKAKRDGNKMKLTRTKRMLEKELKEVERKLAEIAA
tara:strand:- start:51 stop:449 length:399 start_codon:yes stop_codon:yes gene_type:complete